MSGYLLDTHALLWWLSGDARLPSSVRDVLAETTETVFVSAVSAYEVAQKHRLGRLPSAALLARDFSGVIATQSFVELSILVRDAQRAGQIENPHRDPFDRLLIAQALLNDLTIVSNERLFDAFGVPRLW